MADRCSVENRAAFPFPQAIFRIAMFLPEQNVESKTTNANYGEYNIYFICQSSI